MRIWIEKLGRKLEKEGICINNQVTFGDKRIEVTHSLDGVPNLCVRTIPYSDNYYGSYDFIKIYEDEYDYLFEIIINKRKNKEIELIKEFESYE